MTQFLVNLIAIVVALFRTDLNWVECLVLAVAGCVALVRPEWILGFRDRLSEPLDRLARRPYASLAAVGVLCVCGRLLLLPLEPVPVPGITDEFSHLLLANTLSAGRLTNPSHVMWPH